MYSFLSTEMVDRGFMVSGNSNHTKQARGVLEFRCSKKKPSVEDVNDQQYYVKSELVVSKYAYPVSQVITLLMPNMLMCFVVFCSQLKFFFPDKISSGPCNWVYPVQFGGGLVPGDEYSFDVTVGQHSCVLFTSQSSTKVFSPTATSKGPAIQTCKWTIHDHAFLSVLPDAVVPHKGSSLKQIHEIHLGREGNLIFLDWFTGGRMANKELWEFQLLQNTLNLHCNSRLILRESTKLCNTSISIGDSMSPYNVYGTCVIFGPRLEKLRVQISDKIEQQKLFPRNKIEKFLVTCSPLYLDAQSRVDDMPRGCILKFCSFTTADVYLFLQEILSPMFLLYGANPFHLK